MRDGLQLTTLLEWALAATEMFRRRVAQPDDAVPTVTREIVTGVLWHSRSLEPVVSTTR
jgi:hypothetical protein